MDNKIVTIILVMNAVLTIVTTAVVTRLSLNKGKLGITNVVKNRLTPRVKAYIKLISAGLILVLQAVGLFLLLREPGVPTKFEVFKIATFTGTVFFWFCLTAYLAGRVSGAR
jgi:hypothetical protein